MTTETPSRTERPAPIETDDPRHVHYSVHSSDEHCTVVDGECIHCAVYHGEPCHCGGRGFHREGCEEIG